MTDEVRDISIVVRATQAIATLTKTSVALDDLQGATGKTDAQLKVVDRTIKKAANSTAAAARTLVILKNELKIMSKESTVASNSVKNLETRLALANRRLLDNKTIIAVQRQTISGLTADNTKLAESYNRVATAATRANAAGRSGRGGTVGGVAGVVAPGIGGMAADGQFANSLRYQLYDVAATFGILGAAATAAGTVVFRTGIEWDKNFANVVRTSQVTGSAVGWLKDQFLDLQSSIPVTSEDLATIGTLGAQMGVAAANLANFTEVTAKFAATSGVGVDESATALSRLNELLPDVNGNYEKLASVILRTGVNAVATEQQIVRGTSQIAAMGRLAGLTTPEVVALSSAMSSLGFSPELQRSVITSSFSKILTATSTVTAQTEKFGAVLNMTGKEFQQAWNQDALGTYKNLVETIASRGDAVTVLQDLGLASQRLTPNLLKLGQNTSVLDKALSDTSDEWIKNGELTRQYGIISDTVSARIQVMSQSWEALLVTLDQSDTVIKPFINLLTDVLKTMRNIAKMPGVSTLVTLGAVIVTLTGITALGAAGLAALAGGYIALHNANIGVAELLAANGVATAGNTVATNSNTAAKIANAEANVLAAGASNANSVALTGNAVASNAAGLKLLSFSSSAIKALPTVLRFAGIIGIATAALTGLVTLIATAPEWMHDLEKAFNGIETPQEILAFDSSKIAVATRDAKKYADVYNSLRINPSAPGQELNVAAAQAATAASERRTVLTDLSESIMSLETVEEKYAAINYLAKEWGVTQNEVLADLPDVASTLGDGAAAAAQLQDETQKLAASQALWAASLLTTDENLASLMSGVTAGAGAFLNFSQGLADAYAVDTKGVRTGGGLTQFLDTMNNQISGFESFYANLGTLVQKGGVQLATLFAEAGPGASQALTDSLALTPEQISQIEQQMSLAAFYASEQFAQTFSQNNSLLASVWQQTNSTEAVAAFNAALASSMKGGSIDPAILAELEKKFGIKLDIGLIPSLDPIDMQNAILNAQAIATATPVLLPFRPMTSTSVPLNEEVNKWLVEENGNSIVLNVDPATEEGSQVLDAWRANEYNVPVALLARVDTSQAAADVAKFVKNVSNGVYGGPTSWLRATGNPAAATGALVVPGGLKYGNYPKFAKGSILSGPGSGTSDSILARVSTGEAITKARAVRFYGPRMMEDINNMRFPKFANGGFPGGFNPGSYGPPAPQVNVNVTQMYPTTRDPIKQLKQDAESVIAGIWS